MPVEIDGQNIGDILVQAAVDAVKAVTDLIPDAGAMTSIAQEATLGTPVVSIAGDMATAQADITAIKAVTDVIPDAGAMTSIALKAENTSGDSSGTFSYLDAGGEQTVVELTTTTRKQVYGISLDLTNITIDAAVIKIYLKPDGTNYREIQAKRLTFNASTDGDGVYIDLNMGITSDFKVTFTEGGDEGADRDIPYSLVYRTIE